MLTMTRRRAIATTVAAGLVVPGLSRHLDAATQSDVDHKTLAAFVDVLLPADDMSPAASALDVAPELIDLATQSEVFLRFLALGTTWLNDTGRGPFHTLTPGDQVRVLTWMSTSDPDQIPGRFYRVVRQTAVEIYFSRPGSHAGFGLNPAPQPAGYPPPWQ